ncbi:MAG: hypothetical protein KDA25_02685, partial [Phycisphaerales bacterium]|nr:hypothetical protein [Phycisphaerales bacterium]
MTDRGQAWRWVRCTVALLAACGILVGIVAPASAQDDGTSDRTNAAYWYGLALARHASIPREQLAALESYREGDTVTDAVRSARAALMPVFDAMDRAARSSSVDFALDYDRGFRMSAPHLGGLRTVARLMRQDATVSFHESDSAAAAARLATIYRVADQVSRDRLVISSLHGQVIFAMADELVGRAIDRGRFTPADADRLAQAIRSFDEADPFRFGEALAIERAFMSDWVITEFGGEGARSPEELSGLVDDPVARLEIAMLEPSQIVSDANNAAVMMDAVLVAFGEDDPELARHDLARIAGEVKDGDFGVLARAMAPDFVRLYERLLESRRLVAGRRAWLSALSSGVVASGAVPLRAFANAAEWYLEAIRELEVLAPADLQTIRQVAMRPELPPDDTQVSLLLRQEPIVHALIEAATLDRCDFSIAGAARPAALPPYLPGMRVAAWLLQADAVRLVHAGETDRAVERHVASYRMVAHLASDRSIPSSLTAHRLFLNLATDTRRFVEHGILVSPQRETLGAQLDRLTQADPFGYLQAIARERADLAKQIPTPRID